MDGYIPVSGEETESGTLLELQSPFIKNSVSNLQIPNNECLEFDDWSFEFPLPGKG